MKRHRDIVGKFIAGKLYPHREYSHLVIPESVLAAARLILNSVHPGFTFNVLVWDEKANALRFVFSADFDTASEPEVGSPLPSPRSTRRSFPLCSDRSSGGQERRTRTWGPGSSSTSPNSWQESIRSRTFPSTRSTGLRRPTRRQWNASGGAL